MNARGIRILLPILVAFCVSACMIEIRIQAPRWRCTLNCNGKYEKAECGYDSYPTVYEYSAPEFFVRDDGQIVFRFFDKDTGLKLQAASDGPFKYGVKYDYSRGDEYFNVSFDWLYEGKDYVCDGGCITFRNNILPGIAFAIDFEFDLSASDGSEMKIRNGTFTVYDIVEPRNVDLGLQ